MGDGGDAAYYAGAATPGDEVEVYSWDVAVVCEFVVEGSISKRSDCYYLDAACLGPECPVYVGDGVRVVYVDYDVAYKVFVSLCDGPGDGGVGDVVAAPGAAAAGELAYTALVASCSSVSG